jgi:hypothetical protein
VDAVQLICAFLPLRTLAGTEMEGGVVGSRFQMMV